MECRMTCPSENKRAWAMRDELSKELSFYISNAFDRYDATMRCVEIIVKYYTLTPNSIANDREE